MNKILTICIPTYNRKEILVQEVKDYLSVDDMRFTVKVNDNCSTDGTKEVLEQIKDPRLVCCFNSENKGSIPNWILALSNNESDYLIFTLDKDLVDINQLKSFLDYLEREKPYFGFADLDISKPKDYEKIEPGLDNVLKMAYLDKHPSGYFYRRDLFEEAIKKDSFLKLDKRFDFPFEVINAELAVEYPSLIIKGGLVVNANYRKELKGNKTLSYDDSNIWYGAPRRFIEFRYYIDNALNLSLDNSAKLKLARILTNRGVQNVTLQLRYFLRNESLCTHYNVKKREVTLVEMTKNAKKILSIFEVSSKGKLTVVQRSIIKYSSYTKFMTRLFKSFVMSK